MTRFEIVAREDLPRNIILGAKTIREHNILKFGGLAFISFRSHTIGQPLFNTSAPVNPTAIARSPPTQITSLRTTKKCYFRTKRTKELTSRFSKACDWERWELSGMRPISQIPRIHLEGGTWGLETQLEIRRSKG